MQLLKTYLSRSCLLLEKIWYKLDGWKSVIGLGLMYFKDRLNPVLPNTWWMDGIMFIIYLWTGVAVTDKLRKQIVNKDKQG